MSMASRQSDELANALRLLTQLGAVVTLPASVGSVAIRTAAARLDVSADWIRDHLEEFPNWWRLPAGSANGQNVGEIRIPIRDLEAFERRQKGART